MMRWIKNRKNIYDYIGLFVDELYFILIIKII